MQSHTDRTTQNICCYASGAIPTASDSDSCPISQDLACIFVTNGTSSLSMMDFADVTVKHHCKVLSPRGFFSYDG